MCNIRMDLCPDCGGEGRKLITIQVYEPGCGFSHPDVEYGPACETCGGTGNVEVEVELVSLEDLEDLEDLPCT